MTNPPVAALLAAALRDQLLAQLRDHRRECQAPDCIEAYNLIAYLAHAAGLKTGPDFDLVAAITADYEKQCKAARRARAEEPR